jgi:hypothetical protein
MNSTMLIQQSQYVLARERRVCENVGNGIHARILWIAGDTDNELRPDLWQRRCGVDLRAARGTRPDARLAQRPKNTVKRTGERARTQRLDATEGRMTNGVSFAETQSIYGDSSSYRPISRAPSAAFRSLLSCVAVRPGPTTIARCSSITGNKSLKARAGSRWLPQVSRMSTQNCERPSTRTR